MSQFRISVKNLGKLALSDFCPRCFWLKLHARQLPFQIFPGIFSSIDAYTKRVVHAWIDRNGGAPVWLNGLGEVTGYVDPPHHSRFTMEVPEHNILLTGAPDGILNLADDSIAIIDYKTARYTGRQDQLMPMYVVQLNGYAVIAEHLRFGPVSKLALIYAEPVTDEQTASQPEIHTDDGFTMPFSVSVHPVEMKHEQLPPLYHKAREIYELPVAPEGREGCEDCKRLENLMLLARKL
jgi:hypothetical protein